jgi:uncharacterized protein YhbP (UPF0306 family)
MTHQQASKPSICQFLAQHTTLSLATCHDGRPWSTDLFYASDASCQLYFVSGTTTLHCQYLADNSQVSATISRQCDDWRDIKGLQLDGVARVVAESDRDRVINIYLTKFPALKTLHKASELFALLWKSHFYCISPKWIRLVDNSKGFGHKEEMLF